MVQEMMSYSSEGKSRVEQLPNPPANLGHIGLQEAINERGFSTARIAYEQRGCICRVFVIIIGQIVNEGP